MRAPYLISWISIKHITHNVKCGNDFLFLNYGRDVAIIDKKTEVAMDYDKKLIAGKLRRWEKYLHSYTLPLWDEIPDIGYYMEQVIALLKDCLDYLPPELKEEQFITAATINNYVRKKVMPEPVKKKYFRAHIAYLIMICSLKRCLSIATLQTMLPVDITEEKLKETYNSYVRLHHQVVLYFTNEVRKAAGGILEHESVKADGPSLCFDNTSDLVAAAAIISGFSRLLAEKLLLLKGRTIKNGGSIEIREKKPPEII